jgi:hypothetical protein
MTDREHEITLEVVALPSGLFAVQAIGGTRPDDGETFATREEAENFLFAENERLDLATSDLHILKPGGGQAAH